LRAAALLLAAVLLAGCGYSLGPGRPVQGAATVTIPVFGNRTYRRGVETDLARLLVSEIHSRTTLRVVDAGGDLVVEGTIVNADEVLLSQGEDQTVRESTVLVTVDILVRDRRTGELVRPRQRLTERESFVPVIGESVPTGSRGYPSSHSGPLRRTLSGE